MKFPTGHYDNDQINVLQAAHNRACKGLCISETDQVSRERVASMMMAFAKYGLFDVENEAKRIAIIASRITRIFAA